MNLTSWLAVLVLLTFLAGKAPAAEPKFPLGKETTHVDGPLDADGYVDYAAALNVRLGRDVATNENANALLWQAFGPEPVHESIRKKFFAGMGQAVPPAEGSYFLPLNGFLKRAEPEAREAVYLEQQPQSVRRPWTEKEFPLLAEWITVNEKPLAMIAEAVRRPKFYEATIRPPVDENGYGTLFEVFLPGTSAGREAASPLTARAMLRLAEKKYDDAWQDLLTCHRLGRHLGRHPMLVSVLGGVSIDGMAATAERAFLEHAAVTGEQLRQYAADFQRLPPLPDASDCYELGERFMLLDLIQAVSHYGIGLLDMVQFVADGEGLKKNPSVLNPLVTSSDFTPALRRANPWCDRMVAISREKDRTARKAAIAALDADIKALVPREGWSGASFWLGAAAGSPAVRGERIGDVLIAICLPASRSVQETVDRTKQTTVNSRIAIALATFRADHGRYPEKLDELTPKYLQKAPSDLFVDAPLKYRTVDGGYLLYSVGPNEKDDDGRTREDEPDCDDITIQMPRSKKSP